MRRGWGYPLLKRWLQQPHHRTRIHPSAKLVLWESVFKGSKGCTEGARAVDKKNDNKQREHQGQEKEEKNKDEVLHVGADSHVAAWWGELWQSRGLFPGGAVTCGKVHTLEQGQEREREVAPDRDLYIALPLECFPVPFQF